MKKAYALLFDGYPDWELGNVLPELRRFGKIEVATVGFSDQAVVSMGGLRVLPDMAIAKVDLSDVLIYILPGGYMWKAPTRGTRLNSCCNAWNRHVSRLRPSALRQP